MKTKRIIQLVIVFSLLISSFCLTACGFFDIPNIESAQPMDGENDLIVVGVSQLGSESVWRTSNTLSIQNTFTRENGYQLIFNNARQKQENQIKAIRNFISQRVDYIVFSPVVESGWETVLSEAKEANVPVIIADRMISSSNDSLYTAWIGSNTREEGEKAGHWLEEYLDSKGRSKYDLNIVVLKGTTGSSSQLGRTMGFDVIAEQHKNWHILEQTSGEFTVAKGKEVMQSMLDKYEKIDVVVSQNDDMTFGAMEALDEVGKTYGIDGDIILISFDGVDEALELVAEGKINLDVECNPDQGEYISEIIQKLEHNENVEKKLYVDERIFTIDNAQMVLDERASKK